MDAGGKSRLPPERHAIYAQRGRKTERCSAMPSRSTPPGDEIVFQLQMPDDFLVGILKDGHDVAITTSDLPKAVFPD